MPKPTQTPASVGIILIHHRMREHLRACLRSIQATGAVHRLKTVVAHLRTAQDDGAWIRAEFPWTKLIFCERFGIAHMRNAALREATECRYALILDADARLRPDSIDTMVAFMDDNEKVAVCGPRTVRPDGTLERNAKRFYDWTTLAVRRSPLNRRWPENRWTRAHLMMDKDWNRSFECDWVAGAAMFLRTRALRAIDGFDEEFTFGFEDVDWCFRAKEAGWQVWYVPEATVEHHVQRLSARGINRLAIEHLKSLWRFWRKHGRLNLPQQ